MLFCQLVINQPREQHLNNLIGQPQESLDTPALIVDLDILHSNIERMAQTIIHSAGVGWRPHTKAMKTPALAHLCLQAGAHGITCAKLGEAEVMAAAGIKDILIANEIVGPGKIQRLVNLCRQADVMVCVDHIDNARDIDRAAQGIGVRPRVLIEVDVGMGRAGVQPGQATLLLAEQLAELDYLRFAGLQTWEAHTLSTRGAEKKRLVAEALKTLSDTAEQIRAVGIAVDIISCGGTGTYWISAFAPGITEIEAGGGILCDAHYRHHFGVDHEYALKVLATVTSRPSTTRIICDAGFKTMGSSHGEPELVGFSELAAFKLSAEHGSITLKAPSATPRLGDRIEIIPGYSDSTVFLHDVLYGIRKGHIETVWPLLARGKLQ